MNVGSSLLLLALLTMLGGTPAEYLNSTLHGPMEDDEVPILLRMFPGGEHRSNPKDDVGKPLFLTPLINEGKVKEARELAKVTLPDVPDVVTSYSGFITVNPTFDSNLFFWFFEANVPSSPLIMWLQGGPGASSMFGLFVEHGPYVVNDDLEADIRDITWAKGLYHLLYVDQPVGTGFSFTKNEKGYPTNQEEVADDLYEFLQQFFLLFPDRRISAYTFYFAGESYAAKYVPAIAYKIYKMNLEKERPIIPYTGFAIGAGMSVPFRQMEYGNFLYQVGLIDENVRDELISMHNKLFDYIEQEKWSLATQEFKKMTALYEETSGLTTLYNYIYPGIPESFTYYPKYLNKPTVRKAIHVGDLGYSDVSVTVYKHLEDDITKSSFDKIQELLKVYNKVLIYSGQLDAVVPYPPTVDYISSLEWRGQAEFKKANRDIWTVDGEVAGYARQVSQGYLKEVMVRNAGHIVHVDQPRWAFDMFHRFIEGQSFGPPPLTRNNSSG